MININWIYGSFAQFHPFAPCAHWGDTPYFSTRQRSSWLDWPDVLHPPVTQIYGTAPFLASVALQVILHVRLLSLKWDIYDKGAMSRRSGLLYHLNAAKRGGARPDELQSSPSHTVPISSYVNRILYVLFPQVNGSRDGGYSWLIVMWSTSVSSGGVGSEMNRKAGGGVSVPGGLLFSGPLLSPFSLRIVALSRQCWLMQTSGIVKLFQVCWELM